MRSASRNRSSGCPARAGMDPARLPPICRLTRLPRTRGDGPAEARRCRKRWAAAPHARGWTFWRRHGDAVRGGCPARAGMDPGHGRNRGRDIGLPRTRGDGPVQADGRSLIGSSPGGCPARAGMDPKRAARQGRYGWLPRTRGDGPWREGSSQSAMPAAPHARGWTSVDRAVAGGAHGCPARAGMDLYQDESTKPSRGLPRTRGDGPECGLDASGS